MAASALRLHASQFTVKNFNFQHHPLQPSLAFLSKLRNKPWPAPREREHLDQAAARLASKDFATLQDFLVGCRRPTQYASADLLNTTPPSYAAILLS